MCHLQNNVFLFSIIHFLINRETPHAPVPVHSNKIFTHLSYSRRVRVFWDGQSIIVYFSGSGRFLLSPSLFFPPYIYHFYIYHFYIFHFFIYPILYIVNQSSPPWSSWEGGGAHFSRSGRFLLIHSRDMVR